MNLQTAYKPSIQTCHQNLETPRFRTPEIWMPCVMVWMPRLNMPSTKEPSIFSPVDPSTSLIIAPSTRGSIMKTFLDSSFVLSQHLSECYCPLLLIIHMPFLCYDSRVSPVRGGIITLWWTLSSWQSCRWQQDMLLPHQTLQSNAREALEANSCGCSYWHWEHHDEHQRRRTEQRDRHVNRMWLPCGSSRLHQRHGVQWKNSEQAQHLLPPWMTLAKVCPGLQKAPVVGSLLNVPTVSLQ